MFLRETLPDAATELRRLSHEFTTRHVDLDRISISGQALMLLALSYVRTVSDNAQGSTKPDSVVIVGSKLWSCRSSDAAMRRVDDLKHSRVTPATIKGRQLTLRRAANRVLHFDNDPAFNGWSRGNGGDHLVIYAGNRDDRSGYEVAVFDVRSLADALEQAYART